MLNKENVMDYLTIIASARHKLIEEIKVAMCNYDGELAALMSDYETDVMFDDHTELSKLNSVQVPSEALELLGECDIIHEDNWTRRKIEIDGIRFEAYGFGRRDRE